MNKQDNIGFRQCQQASTVSKNKIKKNTSYRSLIHDNLGSGIINQHQTAEYATISCVLNAEVCNGALDFSLILGTGDHHLG